MFIKMYTNGEQQVVRRTTLCKWKREREADNEMLLVF